MVIARGGNKPPLITSTGTMHSRATATLVGVAGDALAHRREKERERERQRERETASTNSNNCAKNREPALVVGSNE